MSDHTEAQPLLSDEQAADEYVAGRGFDSSGANADGLIALLFAKGEARVAFKAGAAWQRERESTEFAALRAMKARAEQERTLNGACDDAEVAASFHTAFYILEGDKGEGGE